jgi:hypothetical protein
MAATCVILMLTASGGAQPGSVAAPASERGQATRAPSLTSTDIVAVIGSDADARAVISRVLTDATAQYHRTEFLLASQMRPEWLPVIERVSFELVSDSEVPAFLSRCGQYWTITEIQRIENTIELRLSMKCGGSARDYSASLEQGDWRVRSGGIGCGYSCPLPDCPCLCP